jgi:hypothetical protein
MGEMTVYQQATMIPYADMERMADCIAKSGLFGVKTQVQALALMLIAQSEGLHPVTAARDYHVIQGRPTLKADTMLARFQAAGGTVKWNAYTDKAVSATFSHPHGGSVMIEWTIDQAKAAKLTGKDVWQQYPRAMLRARVISEGIRTVYPGVLAGMYTPEEVRDMPEVHGESETTGPDIPTPPSATSAPPSVTARDFDDEIAAITDPDDVRPWLIDTAQSYGWKKTDPVYLALKAACAEHAANLRKKQQDNAIPESTPFAHQTADDFEDGLGPVEGLS